MRKSKSFHLFNHKLIFTVFNRHKNNEIKDDSDYTRMPKNRGQVFLAYTGILGYNTLGFSQQVQQIKKQRPKTARVR